MGRERNDTRRAGAGRGKGGRYQNQFKGKKPPQLEMKFGPQQGQGIARFHRFQTVKDHVLEYIQQTFNNGRDVLISLKKEEVVDLSKEKPSLKISQAVDKEVNAREQIAFDIEYRFDIEEHHSRKKALEEGLLMAYALIKGDYCTETNQERIEDHPDYKSIILDNPIELLKVIKILVHTVRAQNPYVWMVDSIDRLINIKQQEDSLWDYVERFKQLRDVMVFHMGTNVLDGFVEQMEDYGKERDPSKQARMKQEAWDRWMAYLFLKGADARKYGSITKKFLSEYSMGNNLYPKDLQVAVEILTNHRIDSHYRKN
jgi:hypothetical protein